MRIMFWLFAATLIGLTTALPAAATHPLDVTLHACDTSGEDALCVYTARTSSPRAALSPTRVRHSLPGQPFTFLPLSKQAAVGLVRVPLEGPPPPPPPPAHAVTNWGVPLLELSGCRRAQQLHTYFCGYTVRTQRDAPRWVYLTPLLSLQPIELVHEFVRSPSGRTTLSGWGVFTSLAVAPPPPPLP